MVEKVKWSFKECLYFGKTRKKKLGYVDLVVAAPVLQSKGLSATPSFKTMLSFDSQSQYQISTSRKLQEPVQFWNLSWIKSGTNRTALRYASTISLNAGAIVTPSRPQHMGTRGTSPLVIVANQRTLSVSIMLCWNARMAKPEGPTLWRLRPASVDLPDASPCRTRVEC